jgi:hypothetical protein
MSARLHGVVAEFLEPHEVLSAASRAFAAGYRQMDAYTPFPVEGLSEAIGFRRNGVPLTTLIGGIFGGTLGYGMQCYAAIHDYPLNVGGRPLHSWPSFVPITFELTILFASFAALFGMFALNRLPQPHHPIFETPFFEERNAARFYLCIQADDPRFDRDRTKEFLRQFAPEHIWEVGDGK